MFLCRYDETSSTAGQAPWLEGLFDGAQQSIQMAAKRLNAYIAAKVRALRHTSNIEPAQTFILNVHQTSLSHGADAALWCCERTFASSGNVTHVCSWSRLLEGP